MCINMRRCSTRRRRRQGSRTRSALRQRWLCKDGEGAAEGSSKFFQVFGRGRGKNYSWLVFNICQFSFWYRRIDVILLKYIKVQSQSPPVSKNLKIPTYYLFLQSGMGLSRTVNPMPDIQVDVQSIWDNWDPLALLEF